MSDPFAALPLPPPGWTQRLAGVSLCMIVRNEERFLGQCLESVRGVVDEINIVDTGSTDNTIAIARAAGARIKEVPWRDDFGWARNEALAMATRRWILVLDADEELLPRWRETVASLRNRPASLVGCWIRCYNRSDDYKGSGFMSNALVRIFPNHPRLRYRNPIHEFIALDGSADGMPAIPTEIGIVHHGYIADVVGGREKARRNLAIAQAAAESDDGDDFAWYNLGMAAVLAEDRDRAIAALETMRAKTAMPRGFTPQGYTMLADLYIDHARDPRRAIAVLDQLLGFAPHFANALFALGRARGLLGEHGAAREAFAAAIAAAKEHKHEQLIVDNELETWKAHSEIGISLANEGAYELALAWFDMALTNRPHVQPVRLNRAHVLEKLGRIAEAHEAYRSVCEEFGDARSAIEYVNALLRYGQADEAVAVADRFAPGLDAQTRAAILASAAAVCARSGDDAGALRRLDAALAGADDELRTRLAELLTFYDVPQLAARVGQGRPTAHPVGQGS